MKRASLVSLSVLLSACTVHAPGATGHPASSTIIGNNGGSIIGNNGGSVISNNGGNLVGDVRVPAALLAAAGVISHNGGNFRLLDVSQETYPGATVELVTADGKAVLDAKGQAVRGTTDDQGHYAIAYAGTTDNVLVRVTLPKQLGSLLALLPTGAPKADGPVDLDLASTLVMGYVLDQYVKGQAGVLDKLPAGVEADTRKKLLAALDATRADAPGSLTTADVVKAVEALRQQDAGIDQQLDYVKSLLVGGLSDEGAGLPALSVATDAVDLALGAGDRVFYAEHASARVWAVSDEGTLVPYAGTGASDAAASVDLAADAPGDGGPATKAALQPTAIATHQSTLYLADQSHSRIRQVSSDGTITTYVAHADFTDVKKLVCLPDGTLLVTTSAFIDRIAPDRTVTRLAGSTAASPVETALGDGGMATQARFIGITGLAAAGDDVLVYDHARVRRIGGGAITTIAGDGTVGFAGDGGPAAQAKLRLLGGVGVDAQGRVLVADEINFRLRRIDNGTISTLAGNGDEGLGGDGGSATSAAMLGPKALALASDGRVFMVDNGVIRVLGTDGTLKTVVGKQDDVNGPRPADEVNLYPTDLAYEAGTNSLLLTDWNHLRRLRLDTGMIENVSGAGAGHAEFQEGQSALAATLGGYSGVLPQADGSILFSAIVASGETRLLRQRGGVLTTVAGARPAATGVDQYGQDGPVLKAPLWPVPTLAQGDGVVFLASQPAAFLGVQAPALVRRVDPAGDITRFAGGGSQASDGPGLSLMFGGVGAIATDPARHYLYASDGGRIWRFDLQTAAAVKFAGTGTEGDAGDGGPAASAQVYASRGMAFDAAGNLYFSEYASGRIRKVDVGTGVISTVAGPGSANLAGSTVDTSLSGPCGLAFGKDGSLYVADRDHGQVKRLKP